MVCDNSGWLVSFVFACGSEKDFFYRLANHVGPLMLLYKPLHILSLCTSIYS